MVLKTRLNLFANIDLGQLTQASNCNVLQIIGATMNILIQFAPYLNSNQHDKLFIYVLLLSSVPHLEVEIQINCTATNYPISVKCSKTKFLGTTL
jgi:hypothetical protein